MGKTIMSYAMFVTLKKQWKERNIADTNAVPLHAEEEHQSSKVRLNIQVFN